MILSDLVIYLFRYLGIETIMGMHKVYEMYFMSKFVSKINSALVYNHIIRFYAQPLLRKARCINL